VEYKEISKKKEKNYCKRRNQKKTSKWMYRRKKKQIETKDFASKHRKWL